MLILLLFLNIFPFYSSEQIKQYTLIEGDTLIYYIPSEVSFYTRSVDVHEENGTLYFSFLSYNRLQKIFIYKYDVPEILDSVSIFKTGLRSMGHAIINHDSILLYCYERSLLMLVNERGEIIRQYSLKNDYVDPKPWTPMPILKVGRFVYLGGYLYSQKTKYDPTTPLVIKLDLKTGTREFLYHFPESYLENNWGGHGVGYWFYYDYNILNKKFIFSFPFDEYVYITDLYGNDEKRLLKSKYLKTPKPYSYFKFINPVSEKSCKQFVENPTYQAVLFDPYRKVYYRIGELPKEFTGMKWQKEITIVVYDDNFNYLTEKRMKNYYGSAKYTLFVSPKGLHFQVKLSEDRIGFKTFILKKM